MHSVDNYGVIDRVFHHLVFSHPSVQRLLSDVENELYAKQFKQTRVERPVFVTGLPRSGTTLILESLYKTEEFSTFTYRHMPMVMAPMIWEKISRFFSKEAQLQERAHGDGMQVSFDSPEAFEEVIWLNYLEKQFVKKDSLHKLSIDELSKDFLECFRVTIQKLLFTDQQASDKTNVSQLRYLSKNNANLSRLAVLSRLFKDSVIVVPFRRPDAHALSFYNQHQRFLAEHSDSRFSKNYMKWIGHYDFGLNFKPINFGQKTFINPEQVNIDHVLDYWMCSYRYCLQQAASLPNVHLFCYDDLLESPKSKLAALVEVVQVEGRDKLLAVADDIRAPTTAVDTSMFSDQDTLDQAFSIYQELRKASV